MKYKFAMIMDQPKQCNGVQTFYEDFLKHCEIQKIPVLVISDYPMSNGAHFEYIKFKFCPVPGSENNNSQKPLLDTRPFLALVNQRLKLSDQLKLKKAVAELAKMHGKSYGTFIQLDAMQNSSFWSNNSKVIRRWIREYGINKIYIATQSFLGFSAIQMSNERHFKFLIHFHTDYPAFYYQRLITNLLVHPSEYQILQKSMYERLVCNFFNPYFVGIFPTIYFQEKLQSFTTLKLAKKFIVNSGIPLNKFKLKQGLSVCSSSSKSKILLYVGRLEPEKNLKLLVEIGKLIYKRGLNFEWWIVGQGSMENYLKMNLHNATFWGFQDREKLLSIYNSCDYFILPSLYETCGRTVLEAIACHLPVIASNQGGPASFLINKKQAFLCEPTPAAFLMALLELEDNNGTKKSIVENAFHKIRDYESGKINARILEIIEKL